MQKSLRAAFWAAALFTLVMALLPHPPELANEPSDKFQHIAAFVTLSVLAAAAYPALSMPRIGAWLAGFGAAIEILQAIPALHRDCDLGDWTADCAAVVIALGIAALLRRYWTRRRLP